ncbi:flagella synthesis protein FlgN [Xenorhabdus szentirmaii]|uniref:Flagella synthesis protein flgN n=2 Tax=Xenorhabdus szentirmaii TaxID=290112 RepID=W1J737_9GAMM|nr:MULTISPECIES: flagellar export chaperone FlgN [Xenorhabdus]MBD2780431.1 flagellar export chaperone FlgN [Xenorhabdus sp. 38]MBD2792450.1 flagellar export chaperone FlgN [Xenorhabdus sp. CUL]MBD2799720.1 flagellar export chaperone FlgN [Xenorhabdus sp. M]MBD2805228.1 flagellar export chaperone FlgN [Xenorhabdus sp. ZM]MBD2821554.1 flagellar export chaperone FlgN [Xenorhabdus sp. 42]
MEELQLLLEQQSAHLHSLSHTMAEEQRILSEGFIEANHLHRVTEQKTFLLSAIDHAERKRQYLNETLKINAPYFDHERLAILWEQISLAVKRIRDLNTHNGFLLDSHMELNSKAISFLKSHHSPSFYGADGQARHNSALSGHKISV